MDKKITYHEQTSRENTLKLRSVLQTLPDFTKDFFRAIEPNTSSFVFSGFADKQSGVC